MFDESLDPSILNEFILESKEHLENVENGLISLEQNPDDSDTINGIFRAVHSIKGGASFLGLKQITSLTHALENLLDAVRRQNVSLTASIADVVLETNDVLMQLFDCIVHALESQCDSLETNIDIMPLLSKIEQVKIDAEQACSSSLEKKSDSPLTQHASDDVRDAISVNENASRDQGAKNIFLSSMKIHLNIINDAIKQLSSDHSEKKVYEKVSNSLEEIKNSAQYMEYDVLNEFSQQCEHYFKMTHIKENFDFNESYGLLIQCKDFLSDYIPNIERSNTENEPDMCLVADMLIAIKYAEKLPEIAPSSEQSDAEHSENKADSLANTQETVEQDKNPKKGAGKENSLQPAAEKTIRVDRVKLDRLMNLVGELIVVKNTFSNLKKQLAHTSHDGFHELHALDTVMEHLTGELQRTVMSIRMIPIASSFSKLNRVLRDLTKSNGKEIQLVTFGDETELDKNIIEQISDPLIHLIRNAGDHGIETPEERVSAGKPKQGTITLRASYNGNTVRIDVEDDGKGLDPVKLKNKALSKKIISQPEVDLMSDEEGIELIFAPGFSTAETVSSISGRGVGMDVVRTNIQQLGGSIQVKTELNKGTTFSLTLPLTLAIVENILFRIKDDVFALPFHSITETVSISHSDILYFKEHKSIRIRDSIIGIDYVANLLGLSADGDPFDTDNEAEELAIPVIIVQIGTIKFGLVVDELLDKEQMIIKPLTGSLSTLKGYAGVSILGDGRIVLILDPVNLFDSDALNFSSRGKP